eukprot:g2140.t1
MISLIAPALLCAFLGGACCLAKANALFTLHELENDRLNPHDACHSLNAFWHHEMTAHGARVLLFALAGDTLGVVLSLPLAAWHVHQQKCERHLADVTEILKPDELRARKRTTRLDLAVYALLFFYAVISLVELLAARWLVDPILLHGLKHLFRAETDY